MSSKLFLILFLPHKLDKQNLWIFAFPPKVFQILRSIAKAKQTIKVNAFSTQVICLHHILLCDVFNTTTILEYFLHFHYLKQAQYYSDLHQFEKISGHNQSGHIMLQPSWPSYTMHSIRLVYHRHFDYARVNQHLIR